MKDQVTSRFDCDIIFLLGAVRKRGPQSGGGLFSAISQWCAARTKGLSQCVHFLDKGEGSIFHDFYGWPLRERDMSPWIYCNF